MSAERKNEVQVQINGHVRHYVVRTGRRRVALTGGVHANVKVNQRIAEAFMDNIPMLVLGGLFFLLGSRYLVQDQERARQPGGGAPDDAAPIH